MNSLKKLICLCVVLFGGIIAISNCYAEEPTKEEKAKLQKLAIAKIRATAKTPPTIQMIIDKVREAAALIEKEGEAAFAKFRGNSDFIFNGAYITIAGYDGVYAVHPVFPKLDGLNVMNKKDANGKLVIPEYLDAIAKSPTKEAWVEYVWPKPGETKPSVKVSFVKKATHNDKSYVVICGIYDVPKEEIDRLVNNK